MHLGPRPRGAGRQGPEADAKQMGTFAAIFFVLKSNWGIGMMAMPFMLKSAGVVAGLGIFVLSMAMVTDSVHRLEQVQQALIDKWRTDRESGGTCEASGDAKHGGLSTGAGNGNSRLLINEQDDHYSAAAVPFLSPQYTAPQGDKDKEDASPSNPSVSAKEEEKNIGSGECSYTALPTRTEQPGLHREYLSNQKGSLLTSSTVSPHPASSPSQAHSFPHERQRFDTYVAITEGALGSRCGRIAAFCICVGCFGCSVAYNKFVQDNLHAYLGIRQWISGLSMALFLVPMQFLTRLDYLAFSSMFGLAFGVAFIFLLTTESIIQQKVSRLESIFTSGSNFCRTETVPIALGIAAFSSEGVLVVWAPVAQTIKDIRRRRVVLLSTMGLFTLAYVIVAIFGYSLYEDDVMAELTLSMDSSMLINKIGVLCYCLTLVVTAIMVSYQTYSSYETLFFQPPRHRNIPPNTLHHHEASYATDSRASVPVITTTKRNYITANQDHPEKQRPPPTATTALGDDAEVENREQTRRNSSHFGDVSVQIASRNGEKTIVWPSASTRLLLVSCRVIHPILAFLVAFVLPSFGAFIGLIGAFMNSFIVYLFPNLMFIRVIESASRLQRLWSSFMICYAIVTGLIGTYSAIVSMCNGG